MGRVIAAFFLTPLIVSTAYFGSVVIIAYPFFLVVALILGLPIFLAFNRLRWLHWWHAALVGICCSVAGLSIDLSNPIRAQIYGPMIGISYAAMGLATGVLFWFIGLFRNERFPSIATTIPKSIVMLLPIAILTAIAYQSSQWKSTVRVLRNGLQDASE